jgi:mitogen-activated protein kinase kinase kinase 9
VLTNKGRLFACGYGEKYALGNGRTRSSSEFVEIRVKSSSKIEKIEVGNSSTGYISGGRAWIAGTIGELVFDTFTTVGCGEEIVEMKLANNNALFLTRKGDIFQLGEIYREGERICVDSPKKMEKLPSIRQIWAGFNHFFALSESKGLYGWG